MTDIEELLKNVKIPVHPNGPGAPGETIGLWDLLTTVVANPEAELLRVSAWYAYVGERFAAVSREYTRADRRKTETFAQLAGEARDALAAGGKVTEKAIEQAVRSHPEYAKVNEDVASIEYEVNALSKTLEALKLKHSGIQTACANRRAELGTVSSNVGGHHNV